MTSLPMRRALCTATTVPPDEVKTLFATILSITCLTSAGLTGTVGLSTVNVTIFSCSFKNFNSNVWPVSP